MTPTLGKADGRAVAIDDLQHEKKLAYSRGYNAGRGRKWPDYEPLPPEPKIRALAEAARDLAHAVDTMFATTFETADRDNDFLELESTRVRVLDALDAIVPGPPDE